MSRVFPEETVEWSSNLVESETARDTITDKFSPWEESSALPASSNGNLQSAGKGDANGIAATRSSLSQPRLESFARHLARRRSGGTAFDDREIATLKFVSSRLATRAEEARRYSSQFHLASFFWFYKHIVLGRRIRLRRELKRRIVFLPNHRLRIAWDILILIVLIYNSFEVRYMYLDPQPNSFLFSLTPADSLCPDIYWTGLRLHPRRLLQPDL